MSAPVMALPMTVAQAAVTTPAALPVQPGVTAAADLEKLRALVAATPTPASAPVQAPEAPGAASKVEGPAFRSLGDSILDSMARFNTTYNEGLTSINHKLEKIADTGPLKLGTEFGEIMSLQIEVARWSMSVMGVDNASKAGTNTIKELSRGG